MVEYKESLLSESKSYAEVWVCTFTVDKPSTSPQKPTLVHRTLNCQQVWAPFRNFVTVTEYEVDPEYEYARNVQEYKSSKKSERKSTGKNTDRNVSEYREKDSGEYETYEPTQEERIGQSKPELLVSKVWISKDIL